VALQTWEREGSRVTSRMELCNLLLSSVMIDDRVIPHSYSNLIEQVGGCTRRAMTPMVLSQFTACNRVHETQAADKCSRTQMLPECDNNFTSATPGNVWLGLGSSKPRSPGQAGRVVLNWQVILSTS
jgi:hypothetical protein